ncbi:MAG: P27 family phage terminase small subunit [Lachnospiraceae bacterium]|nr:P27 family phage terminase small subunit [Lachnospiraceae bacterium]
MKRTWWRKKITEACQAAGTYRTYFDSVIDTLASIMEQRDDAMDKFKQTGGNTIISYTNKGGATNIIKNPALVVVDDLNKTALAYWRDLGLTPAGLKRISEEAMQKKTKTSLEDVLKGIGI